MTSPLTAEQSHFVGMLRSGEIPQVTNRLRKGEAMCCLGVMCESFRLQTGRGEWRGDQLFILGDDEFYGAPPEEVVRFFNPDGNLESYVDGIETNPFIGRVGREKQEASACNDELHLKFPEIADLFESAFQGILLEIESDED